MRTFRSHPDRNPHNIVKPTVVKHNGMWVLFATNPGGSMAWPTPIKLGWEVAMRLANKNAQAQIKRNHRGAGTGFPSPPRPATPIL